VPPIAKCGWSRRAAGYEVRSVRGVPWSVRCGYLRSFDFGSYYQSTPRAAAVRVQLVQGSSGTCLRCTPRLWRVGETGIAHFSPGTEKTLPWRRGLPRATGRGPTHDPDPLPSRTNPAPTGPTAHRRLVWASRAFRQIGSRLRSYVPRSPSPQHGGLRCSCAARLFSPSPRSAMRSAMLVTMARCRGHRRHERRLERRHERRHERACSIGRRQMGRGVGIDSACST